MTRALKGARALLSTITTEATRREHAQCDGVTRFCMYCNPSDPDLVAEGFEELHEAGIAPWDENLIDEDPPADIDEQLRDALAEVSEMAASLRGLIGSADQMVLELTRASGEAQRYRHSIETIAQMLEDDADVAVYIAEVLRG